MISCSWLSQSSWERIPRSSSRHITMSLWPLRNAKSCPGAEFARECASRCDLTQKSFRHTLLQRTRITTVTTTCHNYNYPIHYATLGFPRYTALHATPPHSPRPHYTTLSTATATTTTTLLYTRLHYSTLHFIARRSSNHHRYHCNCAIHQLHFTTTASPLRYNYSHSCSTPRYIAPSNPERSDHCNHCIQSKKTHNSKSFCAAMTQAGAYSVNGMLPVGCRAHCLLQRFHCRVPGSLSDG